MSRELIVKNNIAFDDKMKYAEDTKFIFEYKMKAHRAKLVDGFFYYYCQRPTSAMHALDYEAHFECMQRLVQLYYSHKSGTQDGTLKECLDNKCIAAVQAVQFDLLYYIKDLQLAKQILREYETIGLYPYKIRRNVWNNKNKKQMVINVIYKCFLNKRLYLFLVKAYSKLKK